MNTMPAGSPAVAATQHAARTFGLDRRLGEDVIACNTCKALAVSVGLVWNFCFYKFFVYAV